MACAKHAPGEGKTPEFFEIPATMADLKSNIIDPHAPLDKKSTRPDILARLTQLEREIIARAKALGII